MSILIPRQAVAALRRHPLAKKEFRRFIDFSTAAGTLPEKVDITKDLQAYWIRSAIRAEMGIVVLSTKYEGYGLHAIITGRRSVRRYAAAKVNPGLVDRLLLAAASAPSAHNRQPWRFAILEDAIWKDRLAKAMGNRLREDRLADGDDPEEVAGDVARSYARITEAPLVILVCLDTRDMDRYPDERRRAAEHVMAIQSTAMAMQNILLAAHAEGMGACVMCAPLFCAPTVVAALRLPAGWEPQSLVTLGPPANEGKERPRLPLERIIWRPDA